MMTPKIKVAVGPCSGIDTSEYLDEDDREVGDDDDDVDVDVDDGDMSQLLLLGKFEYGGGPIFKVVLEC